MNEQWQNAQDKEINYINTDINNCKKDFDIIFSYFGDLESLTGKSILEIGSGTYPLSSFVPGAICSAVEPLYDKFSDEVKKYWEENNIKCFNTAFEEAKLPRKKYDEVWFINFLQHTVDIDACVEKAKKVGKVVRVFEPINTTTDELHFHSLTEEFFRKHFPNADIKHYGGGSTANFHTADCVYFVA